MTDPAPTARPDGDDRLTRFLIEAAGVRGVHVRLDRAWQQIRERAEYPQAAAELLGEAAAAAALFTGHAKVDGRLSVQLRGEGALRTLFAECTAAGTLRGIVQLAEEGGRMMSVGLHGRIAGRPARARAVTRFVDHVLADGRGWLATRLDIARHWIATHPCGEQAA